VVIPPIALSRRWYIAAALACAAGLGALLAVRAWREPSPERTRVAVAVFVNRTGDPALEPLGSMAADWVTRGLTHTELVDVVDVGAIYVQGRSAEGTPTDPYELARRNGAGTVVSGSYYLATDTLVIRASVEDAVSGTVLQTVPPVHVPADAAVRALDQLREHVLVALAGVFDVRYSPFTARPSAPGSFTAYQAFVAGQAAYWQGRPASEVRAFFERAVAEDSTFHVSEVWLAFLGANGAGCGLTDSVAAALAPRRPALPTFDRLTLDISAARCRNDWGEAFRLAKQQAGLRPRSTYAVYTAGFFAFTSGHFREAHDLLRQIDPRRDLGWLSDTAKTVYWRDLIASAHFLGEHEREYDYARRLVDEFPNRLAPRLMASRALAALGRSAEALDQLRTAISLPPDSAARIGIGASPGQACYTAASELRVHGDTAAARVAARMAVDWYQGGEDRLSGRFDRLQLARAHVLLGQYDEAIAVLAFGPAADPTDPYYLALRGWLAAKKGWTSSVGEIDSQLAAIADPSMQSVVETGRSRIAAGLGDRERAIGLLETSRARGTVRSPVGNDMHSDPLFDPLRGDPRFERINRGE
jgi:tetratricopeptide (TPR) repeat protein/TolB-like protein